MLAPGRLAPPSWAPALVLTVTVVAFASGSSSIPEVLEVGRTARWVALFALLVVALAYAVSRGQTRDRMGIRRLAWLAVLPLSLSGLALVSTAWSADPWLTFRRASSLAILFLAAAALAWGSLDDRQATRRIMAAIVVGTAIVALIGVVLFFVVPEYAAQGRSGWAPWRYRGLGQNPNTVSLLCAVALPIAAWLLIEVQRLAARMLVGATIVLFFGTILASQSRGALLGAVIGLATVQLVLARSALVKALSILFLVALLAAGGAIRDVSDPQDAPFVSKLPEQQVASGAGEAEAQKGAAASGEAGAEPATAASPPGQRTSPSPSPAASAPEAVQPKEAQFPLFSWSLPRREDEIGHPLLSTTEPSRLGSGRAAVWLQTLEEIRERPLLGYGFGTESTVFVDRSYYFQGGNPENAYLGLLLQLGALGLLLFLALGAAVIVTAVRALRAPGTPRGLLAASLGVMLSAGTLMLIQSYIYSVGNIATVSVWVAIFILSAAASAPAPVTEPDVEPADATWETAHAAQA